MRKIINKKMYDTETAECVEECENTTEEDATENAEIVIEETQTEGDAETSLDSEASQEGETLSESEGIEVPDVAIEVTQTSQEQVDANESPSPEGIAESELPCPEENEQGEKVEGNDQAISYKMGGSYTMKTTYNYVPEMAKSELYLEFEAKVGKKVIEIPAVKVADGVIATSELPTAASANASYAEDAYQRIIKQAQEANIMFLIQQANLRNSQLKSDEMKEFHKKVAEVNADTKNFKLNNIEVSAYASPDGGLKLNTGLAENREKNAEKYLNKQLKKSQKLKM